MFYITFDRYHLNQARNRPGPEHYLCYQARPSGQAETEGQTRARADLYQGILPALHYKNTNQRLITEVLPFSFLSIRYLYSTAHSINNHRSH
jgi:hypothetical protein